MGLPELSIPLDLGPTNDSVTGTALAFILDLTGLLRHLDHQDMDQKSSLENQANVAAQSKTG